MPIIGKVGRQSAGVRALNIFIHVVLLVGAATMIYPFLVMVSSSFKSSVDSREFTVVPRFFYNDNVLFQKYVEARHNEDSNRLLDQYANRFQSFRFVRLPASNAAMSDDWSAFLSSFPATSYDYQVSEQFSRGVYPRNMRVFRSELKRETGRSLEALNERYDMGVQSWDAVRVEEREILSRNFSASEDGFLGRYRRFKLALPEGHRDMLNLDGNFVVTELAAPFGGDLDSLNHTLGTGFTGWNRILLAETVPDEPLRDYWLHYVRRTLNVHHVGLTPQALPRFREYLHDNYGDIDALNALYKTTYANFAEVTIPSPLPHSGALLNDYTYFIEALAQPEDLLVRSADIAFRKRLAAQYGDINALNDAWSLGYASFDEITLPLSSPEHCLPERDDWADYVHTTAPDDALRLSSLSAEAFRAFLACRFPTDTGEVNLAAVNATMGTSFSSQLDVFPAPRAPHHAAYRQLWLEFARSAPARFITLHEGDDSQWRRFLQLRYGDVSRLNAVWNLRYESFDEVVADRLTLDAGYFEANRGDIFRELAWRNYIKVFDLLLYSGRSMLNTLIYCVLAILTALIVNPLAAYALSRFKVRFTYQILLVLMLTMAFPAMVMGIPSFLMLKKLNLLNTFWALILPAAADGYFIFLLKGFFDSLPKQVFESASLDGAGEWRLFWQFALQLSKPILAVIALGAFNAAYRNFMFAFIVCPDPNMRTMMVEIYQLMQKSSAGVGYAALVIAAIPTLLVFVFFQRIIIRGIIVPVEK